MRVLGERIAIKYALQVESTDGSLSHGLDRLVTDLIQLKGDLSSMEVGDALERKYADFMRFYDQNKENGDFRNQVRLMFQHISEANVSLQRALNAVQKARKFAP